MDGVSVLAVGGMKSELIDAKTTPKSNVSLLELAANNDLEGFMKAVEEYGDKVENCGTWYCRKCGSNQMTWSRKTPAMIASLYGSLEVLQFILKRVSKDEGDVNEGCEADGVTALHCAAAGGSKNIADVVSLLLSNGADPTVADSQGLRPLDVMRIPPNLTHLKTLVEELLNGSSDPGSPPTPEALSWPSLESDGCGSSRSSPGISADSAKKIAFQLADYKCEANSISPVSVASSSSPPGTGGLFSPLVSSPKTPDAGSSKASSDATEKDSLGDSFASPCLKSSMYSADEFRMFSFKVCPCSRAYSHDWTECPFVHPGENARRRDPRLYQYSCVPCPDFRKGACRRGDACSFAHGVFECWLHPAQYRTRLCKDGASCSRKVCFFAHAKEELRTIPSSTACAALSPRGKSSLDVSSLSTYPSLTSLPSSAMLNSLTQFNTHHNGQSTPSMSSLSTSSSGNNRTQLSRLKAASSARDALLEDLCRPSDFEGQLMSEVASLSARARLNAAAAASGCGTASSRAGKLRDLDLSVAPTDEDDLFINQCASSPLSPSHVSLQSHLDVHTAANKSTHGFCQLKPSPAATQAMLSNFKRMQGDKATALSQAVQAARPTLAQREIKCHSSKDLGGSLLWSDWGSPTGKPEWGIHADDLSRFRKSASFGLKTSEEPDLSWVQKLLKDGPLDGESPSNLYPVEKGWTRSGDATNCSVTGSWMEQMHPDQLVA